MGGAVGERRPRRPMMKTPVFPERCDEGSLPRMRIADRPARLPAARRRRRRLRREVRVRPRRGEAHHPRPGARLVPQPRPRGDLRGTRQGLLPRRRARRQAARPLRPLGADQAGRRRARRPGDLLRARGLPGARAGAARARSGGAGPASADLADGDRKSKNIRSPRDLRGKRVGTAGIPYQSAYLRTILERAQGEPVLRQGDQRRRQPAAGDAVREGRCHPGRVLERRRRRAAAARQAADGAAGRPARRSSTTTSLCWSRTRTRSKTSPTTCASSSARSRRVHAKPAATRRGRLEPCWTRTRT